MAFMLVLGIETSCDDTSVAIVNQNHQVLAQVSQHQNLTHAPFKGVLPELASRQHAMRLVPQVHECLKLAGLQISQLDAIVATSRPGLLGSLIVGVLTAKTLAFATGKAFLGVNHMEAHVLSMFLRDSQYAPPAGWRFPYCVLAASGGHTHLVYARGIGQYQLLGRTLDDAAGEAFDKFGKLLGLGFPAGPLVDQLAQSGDPKAYELPRPLMQKSNYDFSFSGLKASAARLIETLTPKEIEQHKHHLCASFQQAVVDVLLHKLYKAAEELKAQRVAIVGGVSANQGLRAQAAEKAACHNRLLAVPPLRYCTDNAAMVALTGLEHLALGETSPLDLKPLARSQLD